jgi:asparagine synthase (glutamine-hydrolysing)
MCGIAGYLCHDPRAPAPMRVVDAMTRTLHHRGPDYQGGWSSGPIALGHARLSIIDLRPEANQPMLSSDGKLAVVFNGEIYNFRELISRFALQPRTRSDTEVLLLLYRRLGLSFVDQLRGMFAFALWDGSTSRLILVRDRIGQKPLFYWSGPRGIAFASEARSLLQDPDLDPRVDLQGLQLYLSLGYVPHTCSAFLGLKKLSPGTFLVLEPGRTVEQRRYWKLDFHRRTKTADSRALTEELRQRLDQAVRIRMISDVPLGAFLSGGLDSSAVVALMARHSSRPVKTFSIGFAGYEKSELEFARLVAKRYETEHHEEVVSPQATELLPRLVELYGEPFADPSAVPSYCLSRMTRRHVTVALSGDGADELFAGYTRYAHERLSRLYGALPRWLVEPFARSLGALPLRGTGRVAEALALIRERAQQIQLPAEARYLSQFGNLYPLILRQISGPALRSEPSTSAEAFFADHFSKASATNDVDRLLETDVNTYLTDDVFVKVDIASMAHSLEVRSPMVDHELAEFSATLPPSLKLFGLRGKRLLRRAVSPLLPPRILARRKQGFGIPHARWLRGDLRSLARDTLLSPRALGRGYFERTPLERLLDEHDQGLIDHGLRIWNLLWLELWQRCFIDRPQLDRTRGSDSP